MMRRLLGLALAVLAAAPAAAQDDLGAIQAARLVAMVEGRLDGAPTFGAGIVVGASAGRLYVATADHVVRRGLSEADGLTARFRFLPGEPLPATLLADRDPNLDLAVLAVPGAAGTALAEDPLPFHLLGDPDVLQRGDPVHAVGNPNGRAWHVSATPEVYVGRSGAALRFESSYVAEGLSGGALFDDGWALLGMIRADAPPTGVAVRLDRLLERLGEWGYPVAFRTAAGIGGRWVQWDAGEPLMRKILDLKVIGDALFGTLFEYQESPRGLIDGRISGDRLSFRTRKDNIVTDEVAGVDPTTGRVVYGNRTLSYDVHYRGTATGDSIAFIRQSELGGPPQEFLVRRPPGQRPWLGVEVADVPAEARESLGTHRGAVVARVVPGGPAAAAGLAPGDVIAAYAGVTVWKAEDVLRLVRISHLGRPVPVEVLRAGEPVELTVTLRPRPEDAGG